MREVQGWWGGSVIKPVVSISESKVVTLAANRLGERIPRKAFPDCFQCKTCMCHVLFLLTPIGQH